MLDDYLGLLAISLGWGLIWGLFCSWLARQKNRNETAWLFLGILFSLLALIVIAAAPKIEEAE